MNWTRKTMPISRAGLRLALVPLAALTAACSAQSAEQAPAAAAAAEASIHPVSGLEVIPLTVDTGEDVHTFRVEVARTPREQAQGLMFRTEMGADEGMIFPREDNPRMTSFWMKNTVIPLDIIFIGPDRRIINIAADAVPYSEESVPSDAPAGAVLELNAGRAAELGIEPGDRVDW
jgi:uncharacterized membrane protein (UPF0127 family)